MTTYIKPHNVTSPKDRWQMTDVIWDGGASDESHEQFSLAYGFYDGKAALAVRWNGRNQDGAARKGSPLVATHPTWFFVPPMLDAGVLLTMALGQVMNKPKQLQSQALGEALQTLVINKSALLQRFAAPIRKVITKA